VRSCSVDAGFTGDLESPPTVAFSLIQELVHRDGIRVALAGRDDVMLEPVLRLLLNYVSDPRFGELVCDLAGTVIGMGIEFADPDHPHTSFRHLLSGDRSIAADRHPFPKTAQKAQGRVEVPKRIGTVARCSRYGGGHFCTATGLKHSSFAPYFVHVKFSWLHTHPVIPHSPGCHRSPDVSSLSHIGRVFPHNTPFLIYRDSCTMS
jgi:hypothetical protein